MKKGGGFIIRIEQLLRAICSVVYWLLLIISLIVESLIRPLYPKLNKIFGLHISQGLRMKPHELIIKYWLPGTFKIFGVEVISDTSVKN